MEERKYTLKKSERLNSKKLIERLFAGGNKSFPAFPLRVVYMPITPEENMADASIFMQPSPNEALSGLINNTLCSRRMSEKLLSSSSFPLYNNFSPDALSLPSVKGTGNPASLRSNFEEALLYKRFIKSKWR